jgi:hypothetical protein
MIESLKQAVAREPHPVMQLLAVLVERGEITASAVQALRDAYRQEKQA